VADFLDSQGLLQKRNGLGCSCSFDTQYYLIFRIGWLMYLKILGAAEGWGGLTFLEGAE